MDGLYNIRISILRWYVMCDVRSTHLSHLVTNVLPYLTTSQFHRTQAPDLAVYPTNTQLGAAELLSAFKHDTTASLTRSNRASPLGPSPSTLFTN